MSNSPKPYSKDLPDTLSAQSFQPLLPSVVVLVLHWRGPDKTRRCLESLRHTSYGNYTVLLVDNGSDSHDGPGLAAEFPEVKLLTLDSNYGFAGGCNRGIDFAMAQGADFIWLLNNDACAEPHSIEILVTAAQADKKAAALGAIVVEGDQSKAEEAGIGEINYRRAKTFLRKTEGRLADTQMAAPNLAAGAPGTTVTNSANSSAIGTISCQWLSGSNLLLRASALKEVGLFDERYYLYFEDVDLCHRLVLNGYKCLLVPGSTIVHEGNASTPGGLSLWRTYYHTRNRLLFFMHYTTGPDRLLAMISIMGHFLRHCFSLPLKGARGQARLKAEWLGLSDYFAGRLGRAKCLEWCEKIKL